LPTLDTHLLSFPPPSLLSSPLLQLTTTRTELSTLREEANDQLADLTSETQKHQKLAEQWMKRAGELEKEKEEAVGRRSSAFLPSPFSTFLSLPLFRTRAVLPSPSIFPLPWSRLILSAHSSSHFCVPPRLRNPSQFACGVGGRVRIADVRKKVSSLGRSAAVAVR
jgi:hypothetical protein